MIQAKNLTKFYGEKRVLNIEDLTVNSASITALLGPNGSGKSTLLRCLSFLDLPDSGTVNINEQIYEHPFLDIETQGLWPDISLVFQQFFLWPHLTVEQNLLLPLRKRYPEGFQDEFNKTVEMFGIGNLINSYPTKISVGQKQTVALARAISLKPRVLLLDEITSALDTQNASNISRILDLIKNAGTTILMVTHSINFAIRCADAYIVIEDGEVVENKPIAHIASPTSSFLSKSITGKGYMI